MTAREVRAIAALEEYFKFLAEVAYENLIGTLLTEQVEEKEKK